MKSTAIENRQTAQVHVQTLVDLMEVLGSRDDQLGLLAQVRDQVAAEVAKIVMQRIAPHVEAAFKEMLPKCTTFHVPWDEQQGFHPETEDKDVRCGTCGLLWADHPKKDKR